MRPDEERLLELETAVTQLRAAVAGLEARARPEGPVPPPADAEVRERREALEARFGAYWLSRLGILSLISGVAFLILYRFTDLGPVLRVVIGYLLGAGLIAAGLWLSKRHVVFGRIVMSGGLATTYFLTYALHFVPSLRLIDSDAVALVLLGGIIVAIVAIAHRLQAETVAGVALFLGLHTGLLGGVTLFTLLSTCLLAGGAVFFLVANRWVFVPLSTLVAVYATHLTWMIQRGAAPDQVALSLAFIALYFVLFSMAMLLRPDGHRSIVRFGVPALNAVGFTALGAIELRARGDDAVFAFIAASAAAHALLALACTLRPKARPLVPIFVGLATLVFAVAAPFRFDGDVLAAILAALAVASSVALTTLEEAGYLRWLAPAILTSALVWLFARHGDIVAFGVVAVAFVVSERIQQSAAGAPAPGTVAARALHVVGAAAALMAFAGELFPPTLAVLGWGAAAVLLFAAGFALRAGAWRYAAFGVLVATLIRLVAVEFRALGPDARIVSFVALGIALLAVAFVYGRQRRARDDGPAD